MDQALRDKIVQQISDVQKDAIVEAEMNRDFFTLVVKKDALHGVVRILKENPDFGFNFLTTLCGLHYPEQKDEMGLMMQLHNLEKNLRIRIKSFFPKSQASLPSFTDIFKSANWMERETWDFFGIHFSGHPNLKRILNVEDMIIHPLLKEYPLEDQVRLDKNDTMFGR
jgi:NADH-quinone oxidoreductase subunit C